MGRRVLAQVVALPPVLLAAVSPAIAGIVFREVETVETSTPVGNARQVRQVFADGDSCKVLIEESSDPLAPAGSYVLATGGDAFIIDPTSKTVAPVEPADMEPVARGSDAQAPDAQVSGVTLERQLDEPGPPILGLPTRHFVYRLRYQEESSRAGQAGTAVTGLEERHEIWATPLPQGEPAPGAWQALRVVEDAGRGSARREVREAMDQLYEYGLVLRQIIERRGPGSPPGGGSDNERVVREVTALSRESIPPEVFQKPTGFSQTEYLAPSPGDGADSSPEQGRQGTATGEGEHSAPAHEDTPVEE